jgi:hypothetical protein
MRWKWKLGLLLIGAMEIPFLVWGGLVLRLPGEALDYLAAILSALLVGMLALRPSLFAVVGLWLLGIGGSAAYFLRYLSPSVALGLGSVLSTIACVVGLPFYRRVMGIVLRRHV